MTDILDLPGWAVIDSQVVAGEYVIEGRCEAIPEGCTKCGVIGSLYKHGPKKVAYRDSPIRGYPSKLVAKVQRYKCRECSGTFLQPLGGIDTARRMTVRCREYIEQQALRDTFTHVAGHVGCDEKTVRSIARAHIAHLNTMYKIPTPRWLGIDEVYVSGQLRCIFTDVENRRPVDMLPGRGMAMVESWLLHRHDRNKIEGVSIDMWRPYRDLVQRNIPGVAVVVDKFHVLAMVNRGLDSVRKGLREDQTAAERRRLMRSRHMLLRRPHNLNDKQRLALDGWLSNVPELGAAYRLKESFFDIYDMPANDAEQALAEWPLTVPDSMGRHFKEITTALKSWTPEILAYFTHPYTNAYTEAVNGVTKVINRQGRGYTFDVLRARVLFKDYAPPEPPVAQLLDIRDYLNEEANHTCKSCGGVFSGPEVELHHITPPQQGGLDRMDNLLVVCKPCNRRLH